MLNEKLIKANFFLKRKTFELNVDLTFKGEGITVIQGPSGSGKTTLLRCIAGLEKPKNGYLEVNGKVWQDKITFIPTYKRNIGYVFQGDSLFPHLSVQDNILFGLIERKVIPDFLEEIISILGIEHLLQRNSQELSGGEKQRIAIARAFAVRPEVLLMDEPLSSLDQERKAEILPCIQQVSNILGASVIYVTHDPVEANFLAQEKLILSSGFVS